MAACLAAVFLSVVSLRGAANDQRLVINAGRSGDTTQDLLARMEIDVLSHSPELVVVMAGTNDRLNSRKALSLEIYSENLGALARAIDSRGSKLLLVTVPPVHETYLIKRHGAKFYEDEGPGQRIIAVNSAIHRVARENNIPVVDFFAAAERAGGASELPGSLIRNLANSGSEDGVHPTAEGYRVLGALVADVMVRENLQGARRIVCFGDSITRGVHVSGEGTATGKTYPAFLLVELEDRFPLIGSSRTGAEAQPPMP